jgi:hypothetical protein
MEINGARRHDRRNRVLVDHLGHGIAKEHHVLIERFDLALQLDAVDEIDGHGNMLLAEQVKERILQKLTFIAHGGSGSDRILGARPVLFKSAMFRSPLICQDFSARNAGWKRSGEANAIATVSEL